VPPSLRSMRATTAVPAAVLATGAATVAYASLVERTHWTLRRFDVPVLPPGSAPLRVLQLSDLHMTAGQTSKQRWVAGLAALEPDLVVTTGDNLAGTDAVPPTLRALEPLLDLPGAFVLASNDYFSATTRGCTARSCRGVSCATG
jgi:predicted MPP superfamily phosphohydrolase